MSHPSRVDVPDFKEKLKHLLKDDQAKRHGKHDGSEAGLVKALGFGRSTVRDWLGLGGKRSNKHTATTLEGIEDRFNLPRDWPPFRSGNIEAFKDSLRKHYDCRDRTEVTEKANRHRDFAAEKATFVNRLNILRLEVLSGSVGDGAIPLTQHQVTFHVVPENGDAAVDNRAESRLVPTPGARETRLPAEDRAFADVAITGLERNDTTFPWPLSIDLVLGQAAAGFYASACKLIVEFAGGSRTVSVGDRPRLPGEPPLAVRPSSSVQNSALTVEPHGAGTQQAEWRVSVDRRLTGGITLHDILWVVRADPGDTVKVTLIALTNRIRHVSETSHGPT